MSFVQAKEALGEDGATGTQESIHDVHHRFPYGFLNVGIEQEIGTELCNFPEQGGGAASQKGDGQTAQQGRGATPAAEEWEAFPEESS